MPNHRPFRALLSGVLAAAGLVVLVGCTSAGAAPDPSSAATPTPSVEAPAPEPTPSAAPLDPADVTTWAITFGGMGPIVRGADAAETLAGLTAFETEAYCPGYDTLSLTTMEGAGTLLVRAANSPGVIDGVWVSGRAGADGTVPASPSTETGIGLGSTMSQLTEAYPELVPTNQVALDSSGYAVGDAANGYLNFLVEDDTVVMIGVQDRAGVPKEFCG